MCKYKNGDIVKARITAIERYGAFASIDDEYSGLIHISEMTDRYVRDIKDYVEVGDVVNVKILNVPKEHNQLKLSIIGLNNNLPKKKSKKIKETIFGFSLLKSALPGWIDKKMKEFEKKL